MSGRSLSIQDSKRSGSPMSRSGCREAQIYLIDAFIYLIFKVKLFFGFTHCIGNTKYYIYTASIKSGA
jgi:hypothetical protein